MLEQLQYLKKLLDSQKQYSDDFIYILAEYIDLAVDSRIPEHLDHALSFCEKYISSENISQINRVRLEYFQANIWAGKYELSRIYEGEQSKMNSQWNWEQPELSQELIHLRKAIRSEDFTKLQKIYRCQIYTNAANTLNTLGRFFEAFEYWQQAIAIMPNFAMALGNLGYALGYVKEFFYDPGHKVMYLTFAHQHFVTALQSTAFYDGEQENAKYNFLIMKQHIEKTLNLDFVYQNLNLNEYHLGNTDAETNYRQWCLKNRLFLNPLNDLGVYAIAARDILTLPHFFVKTSDPAPTIAGFYNQMKQEYCSARYFFYQGISAQEPHFSDKEVLLYDTLDATIYGLSLEQIRAAFRICYSILDKVAFFINFYWEIGDELDRVSLRSIWYEKKSKGNKITNNPKGIRSKFERYENLPLRGLFWLSRDILETKSELYETLEPDAYEINGIRNHLEHKYMKIHEDFCIPISQAVPYPFQDKLAYSINRSQFIDKTLRLLKLVRSALMYLSLAVHIEENNKRRKISEDKFSSFELQEIEDQKKL
jgi:hypothetical protein